MTVIKPRQRLVVRGRTDDPIARLQTSEKADAQPARFSGGMWAIILFVSSEAMFFAALFTMYFYLRTKLPAWEPVIGHKPGWEGLPLINTVILVSSSVTMQLAVWAVRKNDRRKLKTWLAVTFLMGAVFLALQGYEYTRLGFMPTDGIFTATFFTLTGFHG
ncbi:MAG: cytochrome c oxidase subunit 3, partial [Chloroflexota bacterium]|nr:cytochrome c oxidase subunit 3 [Chloroflexota bacterium]